MAPTLLYTQVEPADLRLHVMEDPIKAAGEWWTKCRGCGWASAPQPSFQAAKSLHCGVEEAAIEGQRHAYLFARKVHDDAECDREFNRVFPRVVEQV